MKEKIKREELNNLINIIQREEILQEWIFSLCDIESLIDLSVVQYNCLLIIIKKLKGGMQK